MGLSRSSLGRLALATTLLASCTWFDKDPFEEREADEAKLSRAELIELKLERFEACKDGLVPVMQDSYARYERAVSRGRRASARDRRYGIDRHNFRACKVGLADGLLMQPPMPELESAARAFVEVARDYAERSRWEGRGADDSEELQDPRLEREFERWQSARSTLDVLLDRVRSKNGPELLELLDADASSVEMHARAVHVEARPLANCLLTEPAPVAEVCAPLMENFAAHYQQLQGAINDSTNAGVFWLDTYVASTEAFHHEAEDALGRLRSRQINNADRTRLRRSHRDLVRDAKTLRFTFP